MVSIRWLGHASFEVDFGGKVVLFDPWFEQHPANMERLVPPAVRAEDLRRADLICVSHEHFDHCSPLDVAKIVGRTMAHVVGPEESLAKLDVNPRLKVPVNAGEAFNLAGVDVQVVDARHPKSEHPVGFAVSAGGKRVYFAGDTYEFYGMSSLKPDVALLPIGGTFTMDVLAAVNAVKVLRAPVVIPMHFGTFRAIGGDPVDFAKRVKADGKSEALVLEPGESVSV